MLGLPSEIDACLFDLDGVLTQTATVHAEAWKSMFDDAAIFACLRSGTVLLTLGRTRIAHLAGPSASCPPGCARPAPGRPWPRRA